MPEQVFLDELEGLTQALNKNLEKQKGLFEVFSQDSINLEIYKDRAELLRNEEKKLRQDIKGVQLRILDKRNAINLNRATEDFLLHLRKFQDNEQADFLIKTFMRIVFKAIYIQDQRIVNVELNEPWQTCYEEGLKMDSRFRGNDKVEKWNNKKKTPQIAEISSVIPTESSACFWRLTDVK